MTLINELKLWQAAEAASPNQMLDNDPRLLELVSTELNERRFQVLENLHDEKAFADYKELNNALCELLTFRINKHARILERDRK